MLKLEEIIGIILIHWIADFVLQTDKQAKGKSKNWNDLLSHTFNYSAIWFIIAVVYTCPIFYSEISLSDYSEILIKFLYGFTIITFICHTITDYFTSRLNNKLWTKGDIHNFFVSVGFDQVLHYIQLFLTYYFLKL